MTTGGLSRVGSRGLTGELLETRGFTGDRLAILGEVRFVRDTAECSGGRAGRALERYGDAGCWERAGEDARDRGEGPRLLVARRVFRNEFAGEDARLPAREPREDMRTC